MTPNRQVRWLSGLTIIVPTLNESANVAELVRRIDLVVSRDVRLDSDNTEIIFVDDSTDDTPHAVALAAKDARVAVTCIHREDQVGGLGGAVLLGVRAAAYDLCLVMDGDLQHPPELISQMYERATHGDADVIIASRYVGGGNAGGLATLLRHWVSLGSTLLVKAMFPIQLRESTDPMTGFFLFDRRRIKLDGLRPQGFKILLEILARQKLSIVELPFDFAVRHAGESKTSLRQGAHFLRQLLQLRFGRMGGFALVGAIGALINIAIVWWLTTLGSSPFVSTFVAAEVTIIGNFLVQDRFVFGDLRPQTHGFWGRFVRSFSYNNVEALVRIALVVAIVNAGWMGATLATAILLALAFVLRYVFHALVVYAPKQNS